MALTSIRVVRKHGGAERRGCRGLRAALSYNVSCEIKADSLRARLLLINNIIQITHGFLHQWKRNDGLSDERNEIYHTEFVSACLFRLTRHD